MTTDTIRWINHSGYELQSGDLRLVVDPWLAGRAFAGGWALLSPTQYQPTDFEGIDYIWFSHEHPDHFSPSDLRRIAPEARGRITVLFQKTRDKRVVQFCRKLGFKTREIANGEVVALAAGVTLQVGKVGSDSWSFLRTTQASYLNMNDCVHPRSELLFQTIRRQLAGSVDVLLTQFSYASWTGNPGSQNRGRAMAAAKVEQMAGQIDAFKPKRLIPFASYVWFCSPENYHMNEAVNQVGDVLKRFSSELETIVLYPGECYRVGRGHDSAASVAKYDEDVSRLTGPLPDEHAMLTAEALLEMAESYRKLIRRKNWLWVLRPLSWIGKLRPVTVLTTDMGQAFEYSLFGGLKRADVARADIEMTSAVFGSLFVSGYASDAISISGRLRENTPGALAQISRNFVALRYNEAGIYIPWGLLRPSFLTHRLG